MHWESNILLLFRPFASEVLVLGNSKSFNIFFDKCNCKECRDKEERRYIVRIRLVRIDADWHLGIGASEKTK